MIWLFWLTVSLMAGGTDPEPKTNAAAPRADRPPPSRLRLVRPSQYTGMCDASGAVSVGTNLFIVASDEDNLLRLYRSEPSGAPLQQFDLNRFLELEGKSIEADLEAAARIGDRAFWIGSHGRNRDGKARPNRRRFFATDIMVKDNKVSVTPVGRPCKTLLDQLVADRQFDRFHLAEAAERAPKDNDALNIEGLAATPEGHLLIGFRNPIPQKKALIIPMLNPNDVVQGVPARFGPAIELDLGGLGIRDLAWHAGTCLIVAGSWHEGGSFALYRWSGESAPPEQIEVKHLGQYTPEALVIYPHLGFTRFQVLSDDGTQLIDGVAGKALTDPSQQKFRSFWLTE